MKEDGFELFDREDGQAGTSPGRPGDVLAGAGPCPPPWGTMDEISEEGFGGAAIGRIQELAARLHRLDDGETENLEAAEISAKCDGLDAIAAKARTFAAELVDLALAALGRLITLGYFLGMVRPPDVAREALWSEFLGDLGITPRRAHAIIRMARQLDELVESGRPGSEAGPGRLRVEVTGLDTGDQEADGRLLVALEAAIGVLESGAGGPGVPLAPLATPLAEILGWLDANRQPAGGPSD